MWLVPLTDEFADAQWAAEVLVQRELRQFVGRQITPALHAEVLASVDTVLREFPARFVSTCYTRPQ